MSPSSPKPHSDGREFVFIAGHYKSGSTWLANLLSLHPEIRGLRETQCFRHTLRCDSMQGAADRLFREVAWSQGGRRRLWRHRLAELLRPLRRPGQARLGARDRPSGLLDLSLRQQRGLRQELLAARNRDEYVRRFFEYLFAAFEPDRYLLEKSATGIFYVHDMRRIFPACRVLSIYRDGRDVMVSDKYHLENHYSRNQDFDTSAGDWREAMEAMQRWREEGEIFALSYEQLHADPAGETRRMLEYLELPAESGTVNRMVEESSFRFITGRRRGVAESRNFYRKGIVGDWQNQFSSVECATFSRLAGDLLVRLGYESSPDWRDWKGIPASTPQQSESR